MGLVSFFMVFLVLKDLLRIPFKLIPKTIRKAPTPEDSSRRSFIKRTAFWSIAGAGAAASTIGFYQAQRPHLKTVEITFPNLPPSFHGMSIAQITDLHVSTLIGKEYVEYIVKKINDENVDIVAITGDMIDGKPKELANSLAPLKNLRSRYGVFFVTGNHEYYWGVDEWINYIESELNMKVLRNEHITLTNGDEKFVMGGIHDYLMGKKTPYHGSSPSDARKGSLQKDFALLLAHQPKSCYQAQKSHFHYMISGHTHGGQFFPFNFLVHLFQPYVRGLYNHNGMKLYVSPGTGYWGPPNRLGVKSEITKHILKKTNSRA